MKLALILRPRILQRLLLRALEKAILDGLSGAASGAASSEELVPAAMEVGRVEHFPVRVVSDDQPHGHEDDAIVCDEEESLDPQFEDDSDFEQGPPENSEARERRCRNAVGR